MYLDIKNTIFHYNNPLIFPMRTEIRRTELERLLIVGYMILTVLDFNDFLAT